MSNPATFALGPVERVLLLGGSRLVIEIAQWIKGQGRQVVLLTSPRHAAESMEPDGKTLIELAAATKIDTHVIADIATTDARSIVGSMTDSIAISIGAAWIFRPSIISNLLSDRLFNLHGSRLPQQRGGGGFSWQIMMGNRLGFCMLHHVDGGIDTGDILLHEEFLFPPQCRVPADFMSYHRARNFEFLTGFFAKIFGTQHEFRSLVQQEYLSAYWPRLNTAEQAWIDWNLPVMALDRFVCAFDDPYYGAQTEWNGRAIRLKRSQADFSDGATHPFQYGLVYRNNGRWLCVAANGGALIVETVLNGAGTNLVPRIKVGDRLFTPFTRLENRRKRVVYTPLGLKPTDDTEEPALS